MSVTITNNWIILPDNEPLWLTLQTVLTKYVKSKTIKTKTKDICIPSQIYYAYERKGNMIYIPVGIYSFLNNYLDLGVEVIDKRKAINTNLIDTQKLTSNIFNYANVLQGITLRTEQLIAIKKILYAKRGIIQISTGGGKTEIMCATCKLLMAINHGVMPTILILEPTIKLVKDTIARFKKYNVEAVAYSKARSIKPNTINIAHPKSLGNDLETNPQLLESVEVMFGDECHHYQCPTFRKPTYEMPNLIYSIGVSASAISQNHVNNTSLMDFSYNEILVIGATGKLLLNVTAENLINSGNLANPILLRLENKANETLDENATQDWHEISKVRLASKTRNTLICMASKIFSDYNRKVLILVNTVEWSRTLLKQFYDYGISDKVCASYGNSKFEYYEHGELVSTKKDQFADFDSGKYNIMIGTTHLYEGADIKNLDTIILAFGGRTERLQVQGLGRALRKTKTGNYAYIVDFTDDEDKILNYHSNLRMNRYKEIIGITDKDTYDHISVFDIHKILAERESL